MVAETLTTIGLTLVYVHIAAATMDEDVSGYAAVVAMFGIMLFLSVRAAVVPSSVWRTAGIGAASIACFFLAGRSMLVSLAPSVLEGVIFIAGAIVLATSVTSHVIYGLRRKVRDEELASLLARLNEEGAESVARLQELMRGMGGRPRRTSFRRRALARALALASRATGVRPVLRICHNAEETVGRWYVQYGQFLRRLGDEPRARECEDLSRVKRLHAQALGAWITNIRRR